MRAVSRERQPRGVVRTFHLPLLRDRVKLILAQQREVWPAQLAGSLYVAPPPPYPVKNDSLSRAQEAARLQPTIRRPQPESRQQIHKMGGERLELPTFCV